MKMMIAKWAELAGELLDVASREFSNHGCNDWQWPPGWTTAQRRELVSAMVSDNTGRAAKDFTDEDKEEIKHMTKGAFGPPDWWVMLFLAKQLTP